MEKRYNNINKKIKERDLYYVQSNNFCSNID